MILLSRVVLAVLISPEVPSGFDLSSKTCDSKGLGSTKKGAWFSPAIKNCDASMCSESLTKSKLVDTAF